MFYQIRRSQPSAVPLASQPIPRTVTRFSATATLREQISRIEESENISLTYLRSPRLFYVASLLVVFSPPCCLYSELRSCRVPGC